mgnify:CR=1 FL=1
MRSILFLPLDKIERVPKALGSNADKVIFDLEDGLAKDKKDFGRKNFIEFSKSNFDNQPEKFLLRINGLDSNDYNDDIKMLKSCPNLPYSIAIPKIEDAKECKSFLNDLGKDILVLPQIETPKGIANIEFWNVEGINFSGIGFGSADFTAMTGGDMGIDSLAYSRGKIVNASALYNTIALDGVWLDFRDAEGCYQTEALRPDRKREIIDAVRQDWQVTIRRACLALQFDRSTYHYQSRRTDPAFVNRPL